VWQHLLRIGNRTRGFAKPKSFLLFSCRGVAHSAKRKIGRGKRMLQRWASFSSFTTMVLLTLSGAAAAQSVCGIAPTDAGPFTSGGGATATGTSSLVCGLVAQAVGNSTSIGNNAGSGGDPANTENIAVGYFAGSSVQGIRNTAVGTFSGSSVTGNSNTASGHGAGGFVTGNANSAFGISAGVHVIGEP
jgi:hypothetical protein